MCGVLVPASSTAFSHSINFALNSFTSWYALLAWDSRASRSTSDWARSDSLRLSDSISSSFADLEKRTLGILWMHERLQSFLKKIYADTNSLSIQAILKLLMIFVQIGDQDPIVIILILGDFQSLCTEGQELDCEACKSCVYSCWLWMHYYHRMCTRYFFELVYLVQKFFLFFLRIRLFWRAKRNIRQLLYVNDFRERFHRWALGVSRYCSSQLLLKFVACVRFAVKTDQNGDGCQLPVDVAPWFLRDLWEGVSGYWSWPKKRTDWSDSSSVPTGMVAESECLAMWRTQ